MSVDFIRNRRPDCMEHNISPPYSKFTIWGTWSAVIVVDPIILQDNVACYRTLLEQKFIALLQKIPPTVNEFLSARQDRSRPHADVSIPDNPKIYLHDLVMSNS
jgi:hypothetical protein